MPSVQSPTSSSMRWYSYLLTWIGRVLQQRPLRFGYFKLLLGLDSFGGDDPSLVALFQLQTGPCLKILSLYDELGWLSSCNFPCCGGWKGWTYLISNSHKRNVLVALVTVWDYVSWSVTTVPVLSLPQVVQDIVSVLIYALRYLICAGLDVWWFWFMYTSSIEPSP